MSKYNNLFGTYNEYGRLKQWTPNEIQNECNKQWRKLFTNYKKKTGFNEIEYEVISKKYKNKIKAIKSKSYGLSNFFKPISRTLPSSNVLDPNAMVSISNAPRTLPSPNLPSPQQSSSVSTNTSPRTSPHQSSSVSTNTDSSKINEQSSSTDKSDELTALNELLTPDNDKCGKQIAVIEAINKRNTNIAYYHGQKRKHNIPINIKIDNQKALKKLEKENEKDYKKLKQLKSARIRQTKQRKKDKKIKQIAKKEIPDKVAEFNIKDDRGRPLYTDTKQGKDYVSVLDAMVDAHCASDSRRRSDSRICLKHGTDLRKEMKKIGYNLSLSATYLHFKPRDKGTRWGRRHYDDINVKLARSQHNERKTHPAHSHCMVLRRDQFYLASILGSDNCVVISVDDKAKIPLGIAAANKETKILMRTDRAIRLPDHSYSVSAKHKLIPSVNVVCNIDDGAFGDYKAVKSTGTVYVAVRSNYHSTTTPSTHQNDIEYMLQHEELSKSLKTRDGQMKSVYFGHNDGGTDLQIRNEKQIKRYLNLFKEKDLDFLFITQSAPEMSFINKAERCMAWLSFPLSGLVLEHDLFGNHLDKNKKVIDEELCKKNLYAIGTVLSDEVWNGMEIAGKAIHSQFVTAEDDEKQSIDLKLNRDDILFADDHCVFGRHSIQIAKCFECDWCRSHPVRGPIFKILKGRFVTPPYVLHRNEIGDLEFCDPSKIPANGYWAPLNFRLAFRSTLEKLTMDTYNNELKKDELKKLICNVCFKQFGNQKMMLLHKSLCHLRRQQRNDIELVSEFKINYDIDIKGLLEVIDMKNKEYLCTFDDGHMEWMSLPNDLEEVRDFKEYISSHEAIEIEEVTNFGEWIENPYYLDGEDILNSN